MATIIDAFTHVFPRSLAETFDERPSAPSIGDSIGPRPLWDIDRRLEAMNACGVDVQVITVAATGRWRSLSTNESLILTRFANDELRRLASDQPERFVPVGFLPDLSEGFVEEFDRCIDDLELAGVMIPTNINGRPLDDDEFRWVFQRAEQAGVPLWLHPQGNVGPDWVEDHRLHMLFGWPFDSSLAMARLVFGGVIAEHPDLNLVTHHMGAMIPHFTERIDSFNTGFSIHGRNEHVRELFKRFHVDTAVNGASQFGCAYQFYESDSIVFATDYPYGPNPTERVRDIISLIREHGDDIAQAKIFHRNVEQFLRVPSPN